MFLIEFTFTYLVISSEVLIPTIVEHLELARLHSLGVMNDVFHRRACRGVRCVYWYTSLK